MLYKGAIKHHYPPATSIELSTIQDKDKLIRLTESPRLKLNPRYLKDGLNGAFQHLWVREVIAIKLAEIIHKLPHNRGLIIFDTLRNAATSMAIFEKIKQKISINNPNLTKIQLDIEARKFCAHPTDKGHYPIPPHKTGGAIDLALFDRNSGDILDYGCKFDDITAIAETSYFERNKNNKEKILSNGIWNNIKENRRYLFNMMKKNGFVNYSGEWWHYGIGDCIWAEYKNHGQWLYDDIAETAETTVKN